MNLMQNYETKCDVTNDGVHHLEDKGDFMWCRMCRRVVAKDRKDLQVGDSVWVYENDGHCARKATIIETKSLNLQNCYRVDFEAKEPAPGRVIIGGYIFRTKKDAIDAMRQISYDLESYASRLEAEG